MLVLANTSAEVRFPNVNADEVSEPAVTQKRWYVAECRVIEHGRPMGCLRCSSGIGTHNAECRGRIEGILLQQSRMKPKDDDEPRCRRKTMKSVPIELEKPTGPTVQHGSQHPGVQRNDARFADEKLSEVPDAEMFAEDRSQPRSSGQKRSLASRYACWKLKTTSATRPLERRRTRLRHLARMRQAVTSWRQK